VELWRHANDAIAVQRGHGLMVLVRRNGPRRLRDHDDDDMIKASVSTILTASYKIC